MKVKKNNRSSMKAKTKEEKLEKDRQSEIELKRDLVKQQK